MNIKKTVITLGIVVVLAGGGYAAYDYFAGNHIEVKEVIAANSPEQASTETAVVDASEIDGQWSIQPDSKVYFSVTTSKETVNFEGGTVTGQWMIQAADAGKMSAEGKVDTASLQSGNSQRDGHVKGEEYLNVATFPEATFTVKSFENFPKEWQEGTKASFNMAGTLTVKGISKEVTFTTDALYSDGSFNLEGSTVVTFEDFGMKNPHTVVLDTQNDLTIQLRLILKK
ncbi:YceI family protein [Paenibacillus eucommiae]|uniref:Polyisoprenoid-binding protein YceI n=1 Tax=Paenibacillus eucommiae TaxID=1355755 RepID=A0ABS4JBX9_9BACL|nr:YceI family protein [Paenibacillus eucommiae]MBP1996596.1 polyisoprenoid-binding protein YceI [Paenibacillus eucommiae]